MLPVENLSTPVQSKAVLAEIRDGSSPNLFMAAKPPERKPIAMRRRGFVKRAYTASAATVCVEESAAERHVVHGQKVEWMSGSIGKCTISILHTLYSPARTYQAVVPAKIAGIVRDPPRCYIEILRARDAVNVEELVDGSQRGESCLLEILTRDAIPSACAGCWRCW